MRWLYKLEYKYGRYYIRNLMGIIVAGMVGVYLFSMMNIPLASYMAFDRNAILQGQVWRIITFIFIPPATDSLWLLISLYFYYMMGNLLESHWGGFKLNIYYLFGILGAIAAGFIVRFGSNTYLNLSLFLAFATIAPDAEFRLFFILPVKAKWLAIAYAVLLVVPLVGTFVQSPTLGLYSLVSLVFSLVNYFIFFGPTLVRGVQEELRIRRNRRNWYNQNKR